MAADIYGQWLAEQRALYTARGDADGVHLCDLALVQHAGAQSPEALLSVASPVLARMTEERTLFGIDVLGFELIAAGLTLGQAPFVEDVARLVGRSGHEAVMLRVVDGLLTLARRAGKRARPTLRAALMVTVSGGDFALGSIVLEALGEHHAAQEQGKVAALCLNQAALYARRAGQEERAVALEAAAGAQGAQGGEQRLSEVAEACLQGGDIVRGVATVVACADEATDDAARQEALDLASAFLVHPAVVDDAGHGAALHRVAAGLCEQLGDVELAESHTVRAELMALCEGG